MLDSLHFLFNFLKMMLLLLRSQKSIIRLNLLSDELFLDV